MSNIDLEENSRKEFHFALNEEKLRRFYLSNTSNAYKRAWSEIRSFMEDKGFEHTQYSGYESLDTLASYETVSVIERIYLFRSSCRI